MIIVWQIIGRHIPVAAVISFCSGSNHSVNDPGLQGGKAVVKGHWGCIVAQHVCHQLRTLHGLAADLISFPYIQICRLIWFLIQDCAAKVQRIN